MLTDALASLIRDAGGDALLLDARRSAALVTDVARLYDTCQRLRNAGFSRCVDLTGMEIEQPSAVRGPRSAATYSGETGSNPNPIEGTAGSSQTGGSDSDVADRGPRTADGFPVFQLFLLLRIPSQAHAALQLKWKYTQTDTSFHPSLSRIWPSAGLAERELWEMLGIAYSGNENLAPLLLDPQFEGFPLRRGFELRRPEGYAERLLRERHAAGLIRGVGPHGVRPGLPETGRTPSAPAPDTGGAP